MPIAFDTIPSTISVPLFYAEARGAQTPYNAQLKCLLVGYKRDTVNTFSGVDGVPYLLSLSEVKRLFGYGSMLHLMYETARQNAPLIEIWGIGVAPDVAATRAAGSITIKATPIHNGTITIWINARRVDVVVKTTDTKATLATRLANTIQAARYLPITAAVSGSDPFMVNILAKWKGEAGNGMIIETHVYGSDNWLGNFYLTVVGLTGGAGNAILTPTLAAIGDKAFDVFAIGVSGTTGQFTELDTFFNNMSGRWSPSNQQFGHAITTRRLSLSAAVTEALLRNGPHLSVMNIASSPSAPWAWSAAIAAQMTVHWATPPELSRPLQTLKLIGIEPARDPNNYFTIDERQALLDAGVSTYSVDDDGTVRIERIVTQYKTNDYGDADDSWKDAVTMFQIMFFIRYMRGQITGTFPRAALSSDDTGIPGFSSPPQIRDLLIHAYHDLTTVGLVEKPEIFAEMLIVERNFFDANRVDILARPDLVNQLRIVAMIVESNLEFPTQQN